MKLLNTHRLRCIHALLSAMLMLAVPTYSGQDRSAEESVALLKSRAETLKRSVLDNGMICLVQEDHSAPVVAVQIWVRTGSIHEEEHLGSGLCHAIEHMIFKGTPKRSVGDITREISGAGGHINAYTSFDRTVFHVEMPARNWTTGLDVLADALTNASFPKNEWKREKDVILREIAMNRDDPERVIGNMLWQTAFTVHPYRAPVIGYEELVRRITRDDLVGFFRKSYGPDNMIAVVTGDVTAKDVHKRLSEAFADFKRRGRAPVVLPEEPKQISARFDRKTGSYNMSRLEMAWHTVPLSHPDAPALDLLAEITGSGRSSRLTQEIRERRKLVRQIDAWSYTPVGHGLFGISASFDPTKEKEALQAVREQIDLWKSRDFDGPEIDKARRMLLVSELSDLQTMSGQAASFASGEFYAGDPGFSASYLASLAAVTAGDLRRTAERYLRPENCSLVVLSPSVPEEESAVAVAAAEPRKAEKLVLPGGLSLIIREDHRLPFVYFCAAVRGGLLSEDATNNGITRLMSDLMTRGTPSRSAEAIAREAESLGGYLNAFSGNNSFGLRARCLARDRETFFDLLSDCLLNPSFPEDELVKQKDMQILSIREQKEDPFRVAQDELRRLLFPDHPYGLDAMGEESSVSGIDRPAVLAHFQRLVSASNAVLAVFGDITLEEAKKLAESRFSKIRPGMQPGPALPTPPVISLPARAKRREPREQAVILAGFPGVSVADPRRDSLSLVETVMSGLSSELSMEIREKRGLVYYVGAYQQAGIQPGSFVLYAGTREDAVSEVERIFVREIRRISADGLRLDEFKSGIERILSSYEMDLQDNSELAMSCALDELYGLGHNYVFTTRERFLALTPDDVRKAASSLLSTKTMAVSVVLPGGVDPHAGSK